VLLASIWEISLDNRVNDFILANGVRLCASSIFRIRFYCFPISNCGSVICLSMSVGMELLLLWLSDGRTVLISLIGESDGLLSAYAYE